VRATFLRHKFYLGTFSQVTQDSLAAGSSFEARFSEIFAHFAIFYSGYSHTTLSRE
jgi:hypothetical protein